LRLNLKLAALLKSEPMLAKYLMKVLPTETVCYSMLISGCLPFSAFSPLQDLRLILKLLAALLKSEPMLAKYLMTVRIDYAASQKMDWLDVIIASLNVLPSLAANAVPGQLAGNGSGLAGNSAALFGQQVLAALADCLQAASAAAGVQPGRVLSALGSCQLFAGAALAAEPLPLVPLESLAGWVQRQQQAELGMEAVEDWRTLGTLQVGGNLNVYCVGCTCVNGPWHCCVVLYDTRSGVLCHVSMLSMKGAVGTVGVAGGLGAAAAAGRAGLGGCGGLADAGDAAGW
jgi:hypothetical protein